MSADLALGGLRLEDGAPIITYVNEADLQSGMATLAEAYGWRVQTEVVVPSWGRLDLVLHARDHDDYAYVVEFKKDLTRAATIRKAFQQADGYSRWLAAQGHSTRVWLAPANCTWAAAADLAIAYADSVSLVDCAEVMGAITGKYAWNLRLPRARARAQVAARQHRVALLALADLTANKHAAEAQDRRTARKARAEAAS